MRTLVILILLAGGAVAENELDSDLAAYLASPDRQVEPKPAAPNEIPGAVSPEERWSSFLPIGGRLEFNEHSSVVAEWGFNEGVTIVLISGTFRF